MCLISPVLLQSDMHLCRSSAVALYLAVVLLRCWGVQFVFRDAQFSDASSVLGSVCVLSTFDHFLSKILCFHVFMHTWVLSATCPSRHSVQLHDRAAPEPFQQAAMLALGFCNWESVPLLVEEIQPLIEDYSSTRTSVSAQALEVISLHAQCLRHPGSVSYLVRIQS